MGLARDRPVARASRRVAATALVVLVTAAPALAVLVAAAPACKLRRDEPGPAPAPAPSAAPASTSSPAPRAGSSAPRAAGLPDGLRAEPRVVAKLRAVDTFLADVDVTLHALRLEWQGAPSKIYSWAWPQWLSEAQVRAGLDELAALAAAEPTLDVLDIAAINYVEIVRRILPTLVDAVAAWNAGTDQFAPYHARMPETFELLGMASQGLRDTLRGSGLPAPAAGWPTVARACLAGGDLVARAAPLGRAALPELTPPAEAAMLAEAPEPPYPSVYRDGPSPAKFRAVGVDCLRAAIDVLEQDIDDDSSIAALLRLSIQGGVHLVDAAGRRRNTSHGYVTVLGNYAQVSSYLARQRTQLEQRPAER